MVGTTGFEPATSPTPRVRDTRLRYVPTGSASRIPITRFTKKVSRKLLADDNTLSDRYEPQALAQRFSLGLQGYHRRSRSVKKARSESRKSNSILRLRSCAGGSRRSLSRVSELVSCKATPSSGSSAVLGSRRW